MNSNMVKPEKFGHLRLVYHLTIPLNRTLVLVAYFSFKKPRYKWNLQEKDLTPESDFFLNLTWLVMFLMLIWCSLVWKP